MISTGPPSWSIATTDSRQRSSRSPSLRPITTTERIGLSFIAQGPPVPVSNAEYRSVSFQNSSCSFLENYQGRGGDSFPPCVSAQACFIVAIVALDSAALADPSSVRNSKLRSARIRFQQVSSSITDHAPSAP